MRRIFISILLFSAILASQAFAATHTVTNCADSGAGSLRQAITDASTSGDEIIFDITTTEAGYSTGEVGPGLVTNEAGSNKWFRIIVSSALPEIATINIKIRGSTQTREAANTLGPSVEVRATGNFNVFDVNDLGDYATIEGLVINRYGANSGTAIKLDGADNCHVYGNYIGTTASGEATTPNRFAYGIWMSPGVAGTQNNIIGGATSSQRNVISWSSNASIWIAGSLSMNNRIIGNYLGTDRTGTASLTNASCFWGVYLTNNANNNQIGGSAAGEGNVIGGFGDAGVRIKDTGTNSNEVLGNYIGTNASGTAAVASGISNYGVYISDAAMYNQIGGSASGEGNVISGNTKDGVRINGAGTSYNRVQGNYIGLDVSGEADLGNDDDGVRISASANYNYIGGAATGEGNVISGNGQDGSGQGVQISSGCNSNEVSGNYIGTDKDGVTAIANASNGVYILGAYNKIGNGTSGGRNIISGNGAAGIRIIDDGANYNEILGNYIGTDVNGTSALKNDNDGVYIYKGNYNQVGDGTANGRNILSGNAYSGVSFGNNSSSNEVRGNYIGTTPTGLVALGNERDGVILKGFDNKIGGTGSGEGNVICASGQTSSGYGVWIQGGGTGEVYGNYVGVGADGSTDLGNALAGIYINSGASFYKIGDGTAAGRNVISGNSSHGIYSYSGSTTNSSNEVKGNYIGVAADGTTSVKNDGYGIYITRESFAMQVGPNNIIANNGSVSYPDGIRIDGTTTIGNVITQNSIYGNYGDGIKLVNGGNGNIAPPQISSAGYSQVTGLTSITGIATAETNGTVEVFKAEGGDGKTYLGTTLADGSGNFALVVSGLVSGESVVATGTTSNPQTSEFSTTEVVATSVYKQYQPDNMIATLESGADYVGDGIYNTTGVNQTRTRSISTGESATYYIKIGNDGNNTYEVTVTGTTSSGAWTVAYYDAKSGGNNITGQVIGSGWTTAALAPSGTTEIRVVIQNNGSDLSTFEALVTSTATADSSAKDAVKAATTASPVPMPTPTAEVDHFDVNAPSSAIAGIAFSATIIAKDFSNATFESITGTTSLTVESGAITPESIASSAFTAGVWTGSLTLSKAGSRTITVTNGTASGSAVVVITNATQEYSSADLGVAGMSITVPAGAATTEVTLAAAEVSTAPGDPPAGFMVGGTMVNITGSPTTFLTPITVTIAISGPLADPRVYYWTGTAWSTDGITVISVTDTSLTFTTTHLSVFAPMAATSANTVRFGPNPYNANSTTPAKIWYWLTADAETSIYIVNMTGTLIWKNSYASGSNGGRTGSNSIDFDGKDRWGNVLGDGVYIYKIVQGGKSIGGGRIAIIK